MKIQMKMKKTLIAAAITTVMSSTMGIVQVNAANWLNLQGTEKGAAAGRARVWGFIQTQYQKDSSEPTVGPAFLPAPTANPTANPNPNAGLDVYNPPKLIGPNLDSQETFNVNRARLGLRGTGMPLDSTVNYFFLAEFGNNGITAPGGGDARITDASITLNLDAVKIRTGLFKTPGSEETYQGIALFDYINFTSVSNQLLLERFPQKADGNSAPTSSPDANQYKYSSPVGAVRDTGIQFFDTFKSSGWEHSYAIMLGNGNGLNFNDNDDKKDTYLYWASEKAYRGKGPRVQSLKIFAWSQNGERVNAYNTAKSQERTRSGAGFKYLKKPFRVSAEFMQGEGMIFQGAQRPKHAFNNLKASGYYVDFGYYVPKSNWEIDFRIDSYTRGENRKVPPNFTTFGANSKPGDESVFNTTTIAAQYHINKKSRLNMEYSNRAFSSDTKAVNNQLEGVGSRLALQLTHIF